MRPLFALALAFCAPVAVAQSDFAGAFALPYISCDCDPTDFVFRTTRPLAGHARPDPSSPTVRTVAAGRLIEGNDWDRALTVVLQPATGVATRDLTVPAQHFGAVRMVGDDEGLAVPLTIRAGDRVEILTWVEGYAFVRHAGQVYGADAGFPADGIAWERQWSDEAVWLHLTPKPDRPAAWVMLDLYTDDGEASNVEIVCETHNGCVPGYER